jgi:uncharacterized membrane protein
VQGDAPEFRGGLVSIVTTFARTLSVRTSLLVVAVLFAACASILLTAPVSVSLVLVVVVSGAWCAWLESERN